MTDAAYAKAKYTGTALPGNAEVVTIFTSYPQFGAAGLQMAGVNRVVVALVNSQAGTLLEEISDDGVTWTGISSTAVGIAAANSSNINDYLIEPWPYWRVRWTNGAIPQTVFKVGIALTDQRNIAN